MKTLIAFYSFSGQTKQLAEEIAKKTGGDIFEIIPKQGYSFSTNTAVKEARSEVERGFCPKLVGTIAINNYDTIYIGSPNWFKTFAPPVLSFLRIHDFSGKKIIPFCTHGGGGIGDMEERIIKECPAAKILKGIYE